MRNYLNSAILDLPDEPDQGGETGGSNSCMEGLGMSAQQKRDLETCVYSSRG